MTRIRFRIVCPMLIMVVALTAPRPALAWGKGHRLIRTWAVARLPDWQRERIGQDALARLCTSYTSLQDKHAGGGAPELDRYCVVPGVRLSLHDVNPPEPSARALLWYLARIEESFREGQTEEGLKFLGVLCHWNEDPGCPSAHSSPVSEVELKILIPPPPEKAHLNYLYGAGGIADVGKYSLPDEEYRPRLLGRTPQEVALRIYQHQRLLRRNAAAHIVPLVQDMMYGDGQQADRHRAQAALANGRHVADVIYTVLCLALDRFDEDAPYSPDQDLTAWLPEFNGGMIPHPYYVRPFLVDQAMDARRRLHSLRFGGGVDVAIRSGFGMGTPFSLNYSLWPGDVFGRFTCHVGLHETAGTRGKVVFVIRANGKELARSEAISAGAPPVLLEAALPEVEGLQLALQTIAVEGSEPSHNLAVWANPTLHLREQ